MITLSMFFLYSLKSIGSFSDGLAMVSEDVKSGYSYVTKYGFINEQGQTVGEVRWEELQSNLP